MLYDGDATLRAVSVLFVSLTPRPPPVLPDLHGDGVDLGALHDAHLPAAAYRLELLPGHPGEGQQQSGPGECLLYCTVLHTALVYTTHVTAALHVSPGPLTGQRDRKHRDKYTGENKRHLEGVETITGTGETDQGVTRVCP